MSSVKASKKTLSGKKRLEQLLNLDNSLDGILSPTDVDFKKISFVNTNVGTPNQDLTVNDRKKET